MHMFPKYANVLQNYTNLSSLNYWQIASYNQQGTLENRCANYDSYVGPDKHTLS